MGDYKHISGGSYGLYTYNSYGRKRPAKILEHRLVWIQNKGVIPEGYIVHHINGDRKDNRIENLECISRKEHTLLHSKKAKKSI